MAAATNGHSRSLEAILTHGKCDINLGNKMGATALHLAAMTEKPMCVSLLLEHGADPKLKVQSGRLAGRKAREVAMEEATIKAFRDHNKGFFGLLENFKDEVLK